MPSRTNVSMAMANWLCSYGYFMTRPKGYSDSSVEMRSVVVCFRTVFPY